MKKNPVCEQRSIPFGKLAREALPEIWTFQFWAAVVLAIPAGILTSLINSVAESEGTALTSANMRQFLLSWRAPVPLTNSTTGYLPLPASSSAGYQTVILPISASSRYSATRVFVSKVLET